MNPPQSTRTPVAEQAVSGRAGQPYLALLLLAAAALAIRLFHIEYRGLWTDEFKTLATIRLSAGDIIDERMANGHFPTYFLALSAWTRLAGDREWALRLPSAICGVLAVVYLFWIARRAYGMRAGVLAGLFFLLNERTIWASQEARPYAAVMLAAAASLHALILGLEERRPIWWCAYIFWTALGLILHATYPFIFLGQLLVIGGWLALNRRWRWDWAACSGGLIVFALICYRMLAARQQNQDFYSERAWPEGEVIFEGLLQIFWGEFDLVAGTGFKYVGLPLVAALTFLAWRASRPKVEKNRPDEPADRSINRSERRSTPRAPLFSLAVAWAVCILAGMVLASGLYRDTISGFRYYTVGAGGAALIQGLAVASIVRPRVRWSLLAVCVGIQGAISVGWLMYRGEEIREGVREVAKNRAADEPVLFSHNSNASLIAQYYELGVEPAPLSRTILNRALVARFVERNVGESPGFWLLLYKERKSPLREVADEWAAAEFEVVHEREYESARVRHYRRRIE